MQEQFLRKFCLAHFFLVLYLRKLKHKVYQDLSALAISKNKTLEIAL